MSNSTNSPDRFPLAAELEQLAKTVKYSAGALARLCGYATNARPWRREFRRRFDCTPRTWLTRARIKEAKSRLLFGERPKEMIYDLGFVDLSHLSHSFKHIDGHSPSQFINCQTTGSAVSK
ncbi:MAG: helix-turn-helix domain-containing protein [Limisphaerales bacterium]